jgi:hypothetical protein
MNALITRASINFNPDDVAGTKPPLVNISKLKSPIKLRNNLLQLHLNHSQNLEGKAITDLYSATLLTLVQECLFREPEHRPDCLDLVKRTNASLKATRDQFVGKDKPNPPPIPDPWNDLSGPSGDGNPPEPPTTWLVAHIESVNGDGKFIDALAKPPSTLLDGALDVLPIPSFIGNRLRTRSAPTTGLPTPSPSPTNPRGGLIKRFAFGLGGVALSGATLVLSTAGVIDTAAEKTRKRRRKRSAGSESTKSPKKKKVKPTGTSKERSESDDDWSSSGSGADTDSDDDYVKIKK